MRRWLALAIGWAQLHGQEMEWRGPVAGLIFDAPSRAIRLIAGVPGGAYLGAELAGNIDEASIAPNGAAAIVKAEGGYFLLQGPNLANRMRIGLPEDKFEGAAWSSNSQAAVLMRNGNPVKISTGGVETRMTAPPAAVRSIAVNGDGSLALASTADGLFEISEAAAVPVAGLSAPGPCVYGEAAGSFYCLAAGGPGRVRNLAWEPLPPTGFETDLRALAVSPDGRRLYLADAGQARILILDPASGATTAEVPLAVAAEGLSGLAGATSLYQLTWRRESPDAVWLLDTRRSPSVYFVPGQ